MPNDPNFANMIEQPLEIPGTEELAVEVMHNQGTAKPMFTFMWLSKGLEVAPSGEVITIRAEGTDASSATEWKEVALAWDVQLPRGEYAIVGSEHISSTGLVHRWILDGTSFRPGGLSQTAAATRTHPLFLAGKLGTWGTFGAPVMPRLQVLASAAANDHEVYLHVVRTGG